MNTYDVDLMIASIQQALALADIQEKITRYPLASLKTLRIGGSVIAAEGVERLKSHLCTNVILSYASTEAGTAAIAPYDVIAHIPDAVGYVVPGVEVEIVDHLGTTLPNRIRGFHPIAITAVHQEFRSRKRGQLVLSGRPWLAD